MKARIILVTPAPMSHRTAEENLGLGYLAATLRSHGYEVIIIDAWLLGLDPAELADRILSNLPALWVGFSAYQTNIPSAVATITQLRRAGVATPMVAGGFGPTFHTDQFLDADFDIVVRGEGADGPGDFRSAEREGRLDAATLAGISYRENGQRIDVPARPLIPDLAVLPAPARDTLALVSARHSAAHIESARGCRSNCLFCSIVAMYRSAPGEQWRQKPIPVIVNELQMLQAAGVGCVKFIDDSLIEPPRDVAWCRELADALELAGVRLNLRGSIRADRVSAEIMAELRRAGFFSFSCGIENYSESALWRMRKKASVEENVRAVTIMRDHGIYVQAGHILFDHGTTLEELRQNLHWMQRTTWTITKGIFSEMYAADGTPFTKILQKKALLNPEAKIFGNTSYEFQNANIIPVYLGLRHWHRLHAYLYDKTIDVLSAPKDVDPACWPGFHALSCELRHFDLIVFEQLLDRAEAGATSDACLQWVVKFAEDSAPWYAGFAERLDSRYREAGLVYDGAPNPFLNDWSAAPAQTTAESLV